MKIHQDFQSSFVAGRNCKIFSVLDGDIKNEYIQREKEEWKVLSKNFLPITSIEKYLKGNLIDNPKPEFAKLLGDKFFSCRSIEDIVVDYKQKTHKDNDGKKLLMILVACAKEQQYSEDVFKYELCKIIFENSETSSLTNFLTTAVL